MLSAAILAAALAASQAEALPLKSDDVQCGPRGLENVAARPSRPQNMNALPPARLELTVIRRVGRCNLPTIIVRDVEKGRPGPLTPSDAPSRTP